MTIAPELDRLIFRLHEAFLSCQRFLKLKPDKSPTADSYEWQNHPLGIDDLPTWPYWGIAGRDGLVLIDCDTAELEQNIKARLPATFECQSVRRRGAHLYYKVEGGQVQNMTLKLNGVACGEVRANNHYLVAPGTDVDFIDKDSGKRIVGRYTIRNDVRIATLSRNDFMKAIAPFFDIDSSGLTIEKMHKGVQIGERHETLHAMATLLIGTFGFDPESTLIMVRAWNDRLDDPIADKDIVRSVRNATKYIERVGRKVPADITKISNEVKKISGNDELIEKMESSDTFDTLVEFLGKTVKNDPRYIHNVLMCGFSAYTPDPINCASEAPTSTGKTYGFTEVLRIFPEKDVLFMGGMSPKSLVHRRAIPYDSEGNDMTVIFAKLNNELAHLRSAKGKAKDEAAITAKQRELSELQTKCKWVVNLENTIMVFLEAPSLETFMMLRPLMSHDTYETEYDFVDQKTLHTHKIYIRGWPLVFYAKAGRGKEDIIWAELKSRSILLSPAMDTEKYRAAIKLIAQRQGLPAGVAEAVIGIQDEGRIKQMVALIKQRLAKISSAAREKIGKPNPNCFWIPFYREVGAEFPANVGKHMRDAGRFFSMIKMSAAINVFARPIIEIDGIEFIVALPADYERAKKIFFEETGSEIFTGVPSHVLKLFNEVVVPLCTQARKMTTDDQKQQTLEFGERLPKEDWCDVKTREIVEKSGITGNTLRQHYLDLLEEAGLLTSYPDSSDKRGKVWHVMKVSNTDETTPKYTLFGNGGIFTLELLKERLSELNQIHPQKENYTRIRIPFSDRQVTAEELYNTYYCSRDNSGDIGILSAKPSIAENATENAHASETGVNGCNLTVIASQPAQPAHAIGAQAQPEPEACAPEPSQDYTINYLTGLASGTQALKADIRAAIGVSRSQLQAAINHMEQRGGGIIDRGASIEVL
jgi:hypothetical protein